MKVSLKCIFLASFIFYCSHSFANDTLQVTQLLNRIQQLQSSQQDIFPKGLFPCYRMYALNKDRAIADPNIAFTGYITYTLKALMPKLTPYQQLIAKEIIAQSLPVFEKYKNKKGRNTYNFWPTDTLAFFPNSGFLTNFTKTKSLADDLDDTSLILMGLSADSSIAQEVHTIMQQFIKKDKQEINQFFKEYQHIVTYSTWFGKKMPVEIDVSVLCNVLLFVQTYQLPWTKTDSACLKLIVNIIKDKKHITDAPYMSHYYPTSALILFHVARLMNKKAIPELDALKPQMIQEALDLFAQSNSFMEKVILTTTLLRWNTIPPQQTIVHANTLTELVEDDQSFAFFIANLAYLQLKVPDGVKKWAGKLGIGKFYFFCPAYNNMLLLENLVWQQSVPLTLKNQKASNGCKY
ncbi:MAG: hypothetical protein Q8K64_06220 [Sediminibacterium sp.]|nr:hypothetical protein [Sediminibacterium sp.]